MIRLDPLKEALRDIPYVWEEMKEAEIFQKVKVEEPPFIFRADGVGFGKYFEEIGSPRDETVHRALVNASKKLLEVYSCSQAYVSSDEVSVLCEHLIYGGRVEKIDSTFSSLLGAFFSVEVSPLPPGWFDGRTIVGISWKSYLRWRLKVTLCNYVSLITRKPCRKGMEEVKEVPEMALGTLIVWREYEKEGYNPMTGERVKVKRRRLEELRGEDLLRAILGP
ncbi:tRNA (His) guanylyltransferase-like protein [Ignicoccus pacificus DSM 13166]|uniref:tRNA (His) guanylyltransferase-like protein n=1 Tax=Ignicoccus pacificus DSM 13166 TaxID=940294 RepID=A0A977PJ49_9CREN|nr:tRNA (His) guanylyltransferase-like protein [Ignicoccus pacificus DSM 13166]